MARSTQADASEYENGTDATVYDTVQQLGGDISDEELIIEYEKTNGGTKTIGGEVVNAYESYDNSSDVRTVTIDLESHAGDWRLVAEKGVVEEVTLYSIEYERDGFEKVGIDSQTRISTRDGVKNVTTADEWSAEENDDADDDGEMCEMCDDAAEYDVVTVRTTMTLCESCLNGQEQAGVVEGVHDTGWL